jgi:methylated-DNA-[protein]-cysteine S-methyltransferase
MTFRPPMADSPGNDSTTWRFDTPLGALKVIWDESRQALVQAAWQEAVSVDSSQERLFLPPWALKVQESLQAYFEGDVAALQQVPYALPDSLGSFQLRVLTALADIGIGQVWTYGQLAKRIGHPQAARAVGGALARNPIVLFAPCHRVIGADGNLRGYMGCPEQGLKYSRKQALLALEGVLLPSRKKSCMKILQQTP